MVHLWTLILTHYWQAFTALFGNEWGTKPRDIENEMASLLPMSEMPKGHKTGARCMLLDGICAGDHFLFQLPNPLLQEVPLRFLLGQRQRSLIRGPSLSRPAEPAVHICTG